MLPAGWFASSISWKRSSLVSRQVVTESNVSKALSSILQHAYHLITRVKEPLATAQPLPLPGSDNIVALAHFAGLVVAYVGSPTCPCGRQLVRWKLLPAVFMTLATGKLHGYVLVMPCFHCNTAHAGAWRWKDVGGKQQLPRRASSSDLLSSPAVCSSMVHC